MFGYTLFLAGDGFSDPFKAIPGGVDAYATAAAVIQFDGPDKFGIIRSVDPHWLSGPGNPVKWQGCYGRFRKRKGDGQIGNALETQVTLAKGKTEMPVVLPDPFLNVINIEF
ncbi:hypothetical protein [uncultured Ruegeria sp.]|uniref:hypothetical protein n=1 Tax=uncultured Ruegeria sp. TaxID=259304 RepID=UPI00260AB169|nr:hypothetical protein [uncultured Ruegeria sp.]